MKMGRALPVFGVIFVCLFIVSFTSAASCSDDQRMLRLASPTNSHGALWNDSSYSYDICYDTVFGETYTGSQPHGCNNNNVLDLGANSNAHAEAPLGSAYPIEVCYGDLVCTVRDNACTAGETNVINLYSETNSHLSDPNYIPSGAVGYWKFEGNANDSVGLGNGVVNGTSFVLGSVGQAASFDGDNDYVEIPDSDGLDLTIFSLEASFKIDSISSSKGTILSKGEDSTDGHHNYAISIVKNSNFEGTTDTYISCSVEDDGEANFYNIFPLSASHVDRFVHVVCSFNGTTPLMYVDGSLVSSKVFRHYVPSALYGPPATGESPLYIGTIYSEAMDGEGNDSLVSFFDGQIDEVVIYNRSLTAQEIQNRYNVGAYEKKICCNSSLQIIQWQNLRGQLITEAQKGDYVKMVITKTGLADGTIVPFEISERDFGLNPDDSIRAGAAAVNGTVAGGVAVAYWKITSEDLAKTEDLDNFVFTVLGQDSEELKIDPNEDDDPTEFRIVSPDCGSNYTVGSTLRVQVVAEDSDDILSGNISFEAEGISNRAFSNGGILFDEVLDRSGNSQVIVTVSNTRGGIMRKISSIMVVDESKDGSYVAACINKPEDFSDIGSGSIYFDGSTSRGLRYNTVSKYQEVPKAQLNFYWQFSDGRTNPNTEGSNPLSYEFWKTFQSAGHNWATLEVEYA
jgi:hypothetical protein